MASPTPALAAVRAAIDASPRNDFSAEVVVQAIKHHALLSTMTSAEACAALGLPPGYAPELAKARKLVTRLVTAGLDVSRL